MTEVVVYEPDAEILSHLRWLLGNEGYRVLPAANVKEVLRALKTSEASWVVVNRETLYKQPQSWVSELRAQRPDVEVVAHPGYGMALLGQGNRSEELAETARDALTLLGDVAEQHLRAPELTQIATRIAEGTAMQLDVAGSVQEAAAQVTALAALGPSLVSFKLGRREPPPDSVSGISDGLKVAMAASKMIVSPHALSSMLEAVEERFEGGGRPLGLSGEAIPLEARIAAVALHYARGVVSGREREDAAEAVKARAGTDFDPKVTDAFFKAVRNELYMARLTGQGELRGTVLLADADESALVMTEIRLVQAGFKVRVARDGVAACEAACKDPPDVLVADMQLPRLDGVALLLRLRRDDRGKKVPVVFLSAKTDPGAATKALKLGAKDILGKPVDHELLGAKLRALTHKKATTSLALEGSIEAISLSDCFQTLALARRTARAQIESPEGKGEVYFESGQPVAAFMPKAAGEDAFYEIVSWVRGTFKIVAGEVPPERNLNLSLQALLMRAAKLLDESGRLPKQTEE